MVVVDAGVLAVALVDDGSNGALARERLRDETIAAPSLIDLEVLSVCRGLMRGGLIERDRAQFALDRLGVVPLTRYEHTAFLSRCWELRDNLTPYDAVYVALAEALFVPLVTSDVRLSRAAGRHCAVEVLAVSN